MKTFKSILTVILFFITQILFAQGNPANKSNTADSLKSAKEYLRSLKEENQSGSNDNIIAREQNRILMKLKTKTDQGKSVLRDGFDSALVKLQVESIIKLNKMTSAGLFERRSKIYYEFKYFCIKYYLQRIAYPR